MSSPLRRHALDLIERNLIPRFWPKASSSAAIHDWRYAAPLQSYRCSSVGRNAGPNVPFPSPELFALGASPKDRASFDLSIAPSTSARLGEAPTLTCAPQAA